MWFIGWSHYKYLSHCASRSRTLRALGNIVGPLGVFIRARNTRSSISSRLPARALCFTCNSSSVLAYVFLGLLRLSWFSGEVKSRLLREPSRGDIMWPKSGEIWSKPDESQIKKPEPDALVEFWSGTGIPEFRPVRRVHYGKLYSISPRFLPYSALAKTERVLPFLANIP